MNPKSTREETIAAIHQLRNDPEAVRLISEQLGVKNMGPADHIRTKHEIKDFIESAGSVNDAEAIVDRAHTRRTQQETQSAVLKVTERSGQNIRQ